jgi:cell wall-associated NlpC family hydrolase
MPRLPFGARLRAAAVTAALTGGILAGAVGTTAPAASAAAPTAAQVRAAKINSVMRWAAKERGKPYSYGAAGPSRFDCSGLVMYVFQHAVGRSLPHNAQSQYAKTWHIRRSQLRPGDLVFEFSGGYAYHVGIYAGNGYFWHAPHSGTVVKKQKMYSSHWRYGRIIK